MHDTIRERGDIPAPDRWRLTDIYPTDEAWEMDFKAAGVMIPDVAALEGGLTAEKDSILRTLQAVFALDALINKLYGYASMHRDEDTRATRPQAMATRAESLAVRAGTAVSFLRPALLDMPEALLHDCMQDPAFAAYSRVLSDVLRSRPHTLPAAQEALLAQASEIGGVPANAYRMFAEADLKFPSIKSATGKTIEVSEARFVLLLGDQDRHVRKAAFETVMGTYGAYGNTLAAIYSGSVKNDTFTARTHNFPSALEGSLFQNEIPVPVYDALQEAVQARLPALNRYLDLVRGTLRLDELHMWDLYVDTAKDFELKLPYEQAYALVLDALAPLGSAYVDTLRKAANEGWVDRYENVGKSKGAYSWAVYDTHPFVLMNFDGTVDSTSTLAHELGHAMHSYLSNGAQPYEKAGYTLFAAEVASTVNEVLLNMYLLDQYPDRKAQQSLLGSLLESYRRTVFRQTLFATFERETHAMHERGEALTREALCDLYYRICQQYYGASCVVDDGIRNEWMRIPHFYDAFYVYQYATGFSAAVSIARRILREGQPAVDGYMAFLSAGGSLPPLEALRLAGVDMESPQPVQEALDWFEEILARFEQTL